MSLYMSTRKSTREYDEECNVVLIAVYRDYLYTYFKFPCYSQMSIPLHRQTRHKYTMHLRDFSRSHIKSQHLITCIYINDTWNKAPRSNECLCMFCLEVPCLRRMYVFPLWVVSLLE